MPAQAPGGRFPGMWLRGPGRRGFHTLRFSGSFTLSGITEDSAGAPLGGCTVDLFRADAYNTFVARTVSDGSGNYSFTLSDNAGTFYTRMYKSGAPDVAGTSVNTLVAV